MNTPSRIVSGSLFDGVSLLSRPARLELGDDRVRFTFEDQAIEFPRWSLHASPRVFRASRFVDLPNGWQFVGEDGPALRELPTTKSEGVVAWLEQRIAVAVLAVFATLAGVTAFYFFGLPRMAAALVAKIPPETERSIGEHTLSSFDEKLGKPTRLDELTRLKVQNGFDHLTPGLPRGVRARLEFRSTPGLGPNAFALPGGVIVVTDELVQACTPDQAIAVLAHELGHVQHQHPLKNLVQQLGVGTLFAALANDASALTFSASALPMLLATAQYSQDFEREADATGFRLLQRAGYSPELFAGCLELIGKQVGKYDVGLLDYVSSHPPDDERIERARAAAASSKTPKP